MTAASDGSVSVRRSAWIVLLEWALVAMAVVCGGLFVLGLIVAFASHGSAGLVELVGLAAGATVLRLAVGQTGLTRLALIAQAADLLTFALAWQDGRAEANPIARWLVEAATAGFPADYWFAIVLAGFTLMALKVGLAILLIGLASRIGRYRMAVLVVALVAGIVGAATNLLVLPWASLG